MAASTRLDIRNTHAQAQLPDEFVIAGVNLSWVTPEHRLLAVSAALFCAYLVASIAQEFVIDHMQFRHPIVLAMSIPAVTVIGSTCLGGYTQRRAPHFQHAMVGLLNLLSAQLSNMALLYLSYPAQIICKSSKVVPVMLVGVALYGRQFAFSRYVAAALLVAGLATFAWADSDAGASTPEGFAIITIALLCDAFLGNMQEAVLITYNASHLEASAYSQTWSMLFSILFIVIRSAFSYVSLLETGAQVVPGARSSRHSSHHDARLVSDPTPFMHWVLVSTGVAVYAVSNWLGYFCVLALISLSDSAMTVFVTSTRKAATIGLSYLIFPKKILREHVLGLALVAIGIYVQARSRAIRKNEPDHVARKYSKADYVVQETLTSGRRRTANQIAV